MKNKVNNSKSDLLKFLTEIESNPQTAALETDSGRHPTIDDVISVHWKHEDVIHYLNTEKDPVRLARWCRIYLDLDW